MQIVAPSRRPSLVRVFKDRQDPVLPISLAMRKLFFVFLFFLPRTVALSGLTRMLGSIPALRTVSGRPHHAPHHLAALQLGRSSALPIALVTMASASSARSACRLVLHFT